LEFNTDTTATTVAMMDKTDGVIGWAFWTWKRAPGSPSLCVCVFTPPPEWSKVVGWLTGAPFASRPSQADVAAGAEAFSLIERPGRPAAPERKSGSRRSSAEVLQLSKR
jgi:hypothetical protein